LAAKPSCLILVNQNLKTPSMEFLCHANVQRFYYPPKAESKKDKDVKKIETVVLSITGKKNALKKQEEKKRREAAAAATAAAAAASPSTTGQPEDEKMETDQATAAAAAAAKLKAKEARVQEEKSRPTHRLNNPARVIPKQKEYMGFVDQKTYKPMKTLVKGGIVVADRLDKEKEET
uniref:RPN2_C domain-containing protein n=2 Tax=Caenorhabditis japonica TaxID=281687 RepID=A0A8R1EJ80_CAEJA